MEPKLDCEFVWEAGGLEEYYATITPSLRQMGFYDDIEELISKKPEIDIII
jgi:hypothetical protein